MARTLSRSHPPHLKRRVKALRQRLSRTGTQAFLVLDPRDIRYLTGFVGHDSWALIPNRLSEVYVLSDSRYEEQIQTEAPHVRALIRKAGLGDELNKLKIKLGLQRIAVQESSLTVSQRRTLSKKVGAQTLRPLNGGLLEQRAVKDDKELALIRKAVRIAEEAFRRTLAHIRPGMTEFEVTAYIEYQMRLLGAEQSAFETIVACGPSSSRPHAVPGRRKVAKNGLVLLDWGARYRGYCSDLTRVIGLGRLPSPMREIYSIVLDAQMAAIDAIGPGQRLKDIDTVARRVIKKAGYGDRFGHGLGHGIGLDIHEEPVLSSRSKGVLQPGHVVTVEPGIYLPGIGGVRIEDDVLVTRRGRRVLSHLPKSLESAMI